ncbi:glutathione S-transferase N-terminal domain-containing protein [Paraburkholderia strydomiana]|uniref:glutathione S-transferase N-terminal domain-containing protein n=1 Tax=Paraburkholderia strydomiana TaxID=1245417 RepID=UPI0038B75B97
MKLYHAPGSCSQAICIVLQETGLNADVVTVDARRHLLPDGTSYYDVSELGYVPLLELQDGTFLREGTVIAQYLADQSPESKLAPAHGSIERYRLLERLNFLSTEIHKGFIPLLYAVAAGKWVDTARPKLESRWAAGGLSDANRRMPRVALLNWPGPKPIVFSRTFVARTPAAGPKQDRLA